MRLADGWSHRESNSRERGNEPTNREDTQSVPL